MDRILHIAAIALALLVAGIAIAFIGTMLNGVLDLSRDIIRSLRNAWKQAMSLRGHRFYRANIPAERLRFARLPITTKSLAISGLVLLILGCYGRIAIMNGIHPESIGESLEKFFRNLFNLRILTALGNIAALEADAALVASVILLVLALCGWHANSVHRLYGLGLDAILMLACIIVSCLCGVFLVPWLNVRLWNESDWLGSIQPIAMYVLIIPVTILAASPWKHMCDNLRSVSQVFVVGLLTLPLIVAASFVLLICFCKLLSVIVVVYILSMAPAYFSGKRHEPTEEEKREEKLMLLDLRISSGGADYLTIEEREFIYRAGVCGELSPYSASYSLYEKEKERYS